MDGWRGADVDFNVIYCTFRLRYAELKRRIVQRMESLKVRL